MLPLFKAALQTSRRAGNPMGMRDIRELKRQSALHIADLLQTQIEIGISYCSVAEHCSSREKQERLVALAERQLDAANTWIWKINLEHAFFDELTARLEYLKLKVASVRSRWS
jgi:hypothetical protein